MKRLSLLNLLPCKVCVFLLFILNFGYVFSQTADFKVQHIQDDVARSGGTNTSFSAVSSLNNAIELANNNRKTHAGPSDNENSHAGDDMAGGRQLTNPNTLTYYREANSVNRDMRFNTSIWEYVGPANGGNEIIVRGRYAVNLNGTNNSVTQTVSGIVNVNKCIPFITGIMNNARAQDADSATAIAYLENATTLRVQKGSNANNVRVYITLVEFTGSNWTVLHGDSGNSSSDTGTITLRDGSDGSGTATNVSSWNEAIIFSQFRADINSSGSNDALADLWPVTDPGTNNQSVDWTFHSNHDSAGTNRHFVHVLVNSGLNVTRYQNTSHTANETTINITSAGLTDFNQALIVGASSSSGNGTAYGRGWRNYYLKSTTQAAHWSHRDRNNMSHEIQIIDLAGLQSTIIGPEINVKGNGVDIPNGNTAISILDDTSFGGVEITGGVSVSHTFTIQNLGSTDITLTNPNPYVTISGSTDFTLTSTPNSTITGGGSTTFTITYNPTTSGTHIATISIANNDADEALYTFLVKGTGDYCNSAGNFDYNTSITYVSFNTISNADNGVKDNVYEDFTSISTSVYKSSTYDLVINVDTDGWGTAYTNVWIDWNRDGDFDDFGEEYDMGLVFSDTDVPTSNSLPMLITVPVNAEIGSTRMRISTKYEGYPTSCENSYDGEVEDYTINIVDYLVDFDGVDDHIDFSDNHDLTGAFSLESWVYQENTVATGTILSKGNIDASLKTGYHLSLKNNYPNLTWYDNSNNEVLNLTSPFDIPNNEWHHIAVSYDGSDVVMYIDGIEVVSGSPSSAPLNNSQDFKIGADLENFLTAPFEMNYFDGAIQEVRIWDVALTEAQIREMMNQYIEQNTTNVQGAVTKTTISGGLLWTNLLGYYPLDSNTAFDSSSYSIDGIPHNIDTSQITTAPLPYKTKADSSWDTSATWLNNNDIYIPNTVGIDGVTVIDWNIVELTNDVTSGSRDIFLNGLISLIGTLTIDGATNMVTGTGTGQSLTISHYLELDGVIDLDGESQLIQLEGSIVDADSGGYILRDQQGTANAFNYNYWSSSVGPIGGNASARGTGISSTNANYTISQVLNDGTNPTAYQNLMFYTTPSIGGAVPPPGFMPISTYWLFKFYGAVDNYSAWASIDEVSSILAGEGFTMKGTMEGVPVSDKQNYVFKGVPNNGDITLQLNKISGTGDVERLIGNPYPSAIDATEFILDNISVADGGNNTNGTIFNGALYFWDHFGHENSHYLSGYVGGYATRNLTGGARAISSDNRINDNFALGIKEPGQYIPVNQGFFVSTALDASVTPILTVDGGDVVFKNSQRVFATENTSTSLFFKSSNNKKTKTSAKTNVNETPTIRLMYDSPLGFHRQIVVGLKEKASNGFDLGYDAFMADVNEEDMYWIFDNNQFVIQGVNNFEEIQELALGVVVKQSGTAVIKIDALENIDANKSIYISDTTTGEVTEINNKPFEVYLETGTYNDRFKLVFQKSTQSLKVEEFDNANNVLVYFDSKASHLNIINKQSIYLSHLKLYNILGQSIIDFDLDSSNDTSIPLSVKRGAYIVKLETEDGLVSKKIIIE